MAGTGQSDVDWRERQSDLRVWLESCTGERALSAAAMRERQRRAARSLWGWLPLAILIFWATFILTKYIAFSADELAMPDYDILVVGRTDDPVITDIGGKANAMTVRFLLPRGASAVRLGAVASGQACVQHAAEEPVPIRSGIWYDDAPFLDPADNQMVTGRRVQIDLGNQIHYRAMPLYGRKVDVAEITCRVSWQPQRTSFASYRVRVNNVDPGPVRDAPKHADPPLALSAAAPYLSEARLLTLAARPSQSNDERTVVPDDFVEIAWKPLDVSEFRDVMLIVIGAFIAFGAAIVIEAVRAQIQLAIDGRSSPDGEETIR
ncbi:MAG TPA: hypothetical protein VGD01_15610 [Candidatus Elarobacter sp.]|jgi:hypothetical protein